MPLYICILGNRLMPKDRHSDLVFPLKAMDAKRMLFWDPVVAVAAAARQSLANLEYFLPNFWQDLHHAAWNLVRTK